MPPRGDKADLTDTELRNAIIYMFNPGMPRKDVSAGTPATAPGRPAGNVKSVAGLDIHLGFLPAEVLRSYPKDSVERKMHGGVPRGSGYHHVNISVIDAATKAPVSGAKVDVRIDEPGMTGESKTLEPVTVGAMPSYGHFFRLRGNTNYVVTVRVRKPDSAEPIEARFEHKLY